MAMTIGLGTPVTLQVKPQVQSKLTPIDEASVTARGGSDATDGVYTPPALIEAVAASSEDAPAFLSEQLVQHVSRDQPKQALKDLSLNLAAFLEQDVTAADQTLTQYRYASMGYASVPLDAASFESDERSSQQELRLSIKTKDGDTLIFSFRRETGYGHTDTRNGIGYQSLAVSFELDGKLSEREKKELAGLSEGLNKLANDYFSGQGAELADLQLDKLSTIGELSVSLEGMGPQKIKLTMTDSELSRDYQIQMNGSTIEMSRDKLSLIGSSDPQRQQAALNHYRQMLIDGVDRSHGSAGQEALILDAFNLLHGIDSETENSVELTEAESNMLTGLADFSFAFEGAVTRSTFNPQVGALAEQMSFSLSQETHIRSDGPLDRQIDQRQNWTLKSSYFEPLPYLDDVDFDNQNYQYVTLEEQAQVHTQVGLIDGRVQAVQSQHFDSERNEMTVSEGEVVGWKKTVHSLDEFRDFTARLRNQSDQGQAVLLEELLLDPQAMAKRATKQTTEQERP